MDSCAAGSVCRNAASRASEYGSGRAPPGEREEITLRTPTRSSGDARKASRYPRANGSRRKKRPSVRCTVSIANQIRALLVIARADFKLKYAGSALGYVWSAVKPLALFTMLVMINGPGATDADPGFSVSGADARRPVPLDTQSEDPDNEALDISDGVEA